MSNSKDEENNNNKVFQQSSLREDLIQTAVKFLQNPKITNSPLAQKQNFLRRKGMSDEEIRIACERSGTYALHENANNVTPPLPLTPVQFHQDANVQLSLLDRIKEIVHNVALLSAVVYAIYMFYKKFIKPYLFGEEKKKNIESSLQEFEKNVTSSITELKDDVSSIKVEIEKISQVADNQTQRHLQSLQSDISTVKGLLLSRKQFPSVANSPVVPPSIPAWQMASESADVEQDPKSEELIEIGSGSTSSEPEHGTKNSDSSIEIM